MLSEDPAYRRVKVGGTGAFGSASYWLGTDHLLVVILNGYVENYRRFMFADIQAVVVRKSRLQYAYGFGSALLAISCLLGLLNVLGAQSPGRLSTAGQVGVGVLALLTLVFVGLVVGNWALGPTCVVHLRTAVQTTTLPHLTRWRKAQKLIGELSPLVMRAQGWQAEPEEPTQAPAQGPMQGESAGATTEPAGETPPPGAQVP